MALADRGRTGPDAWPDEPAHALAALGALPAGIVLLQPVRDQHGEVDDLVVAYANRLAGAVAGLPAADLLGKPVREALPGLSPELFGGFAQALATGRSFHARLDHHEAFGGDRRADPVAVTASLLGDALLVVIDDDASRGQSASAARLFRAVLDATSDWVSIADAGQNLVYINPGGRRMIGLDLDEDIGGRRIGEFSPAWARDLVQQVALPAVRRDGVWRGEGGRLHRDGHEIPVSQVIVAGTDARGEVEFYATIARDMTRERAAEAALRASEERFRVAFEQAPVGMALLDLEGRYLQVNNAYCRTVQRSRSELIGIRPAAITHPDDIADSLYAVRRLLEGEVTDYSFEKRYLAPDGETIWAELSATVLHGDDGEPQFLIGMIQSIGDRRLAQTLQRSMMTTQLPEVDGIDVAVRYLPGSRQTEVGGDWYDLIPLPGRCFGVVIGDVVGRGIEAAVTMSQLRTALRAYAIEGLAPAEVVSKLHRLAHHLSEGLSTTLVYMDFDPQTRELRYVSAGHVPALHVDASGVVTYLEDARSTPLGTLPPDRPIPEATLVLEPGETIVLYTDGLVERRDDGIISRLEQLREAVACAPRDLEACLEDVTTRLTGDALRHDDIALLAFRLL